MKISRISLPLNYTNAYWVNNFAFLKQYIMSELGSPIIRVELTETMLIQCIHEAIHTYMKWDAKIFDLDVYVTQMDGNNEIKLSSITEKQIETSLIKDVFFEESTNVFGFSTPLDDGLVAAFPLRSVLDMTEGAFNMANYYMARQNLEDANTVLGLKKRWEIIGGDTIKVYPANHHNTGYNHVAILFGEMLTPEKAEEDDFIRAYAVAKAKTILGTVRRKFSSFAAAGGAAASDGSDLISEGKADMEALVQGLKDSRPSLPMMQY
jgi:hypothetical protein